MGFLPLAYNNAKICTTKKQIRCYTLMSRTRFPISCVSRWTILFTGANGGGTPECIERRCPA